MYQQSALNVGKKINNQNHILSRLWHSNVRKIPVKFQKDVVPREKLSINEPVSGSLNYGDMGKLRKFEWDASSLNTRGFLRFQKAYSPPKDAQLTIYKLASSIVGNQAKDTSIKTFELSDPKIKFDILSKAFEEFNHSVPNSMLYMIKTVDDIAKYYATPISTSTPFEALVNNKDDLPPNLHVQKDPIRFHPDTDTIFGGLTAFPKSSTIVTGLRAKKKYKGFEAKKSWP